MAICNDNNGAISTIATGVYCTVEAPPPPTTMGSVGSDCQVIESFSYQIYGAATCTGTVNLQVKGGDNTYRTVAIAPFPLTLAANIVSVGQINLSCHGVQFSITLATGTITLAELVAECPAIAEE